MSSPSFLLFDLGGVLIENAGFDRLATLLKTPITINTLKDRWLASRSVRDFELGLVTPERFATSFVMEWDLSLSPEALLAEFETWPKSFYPGARELLAELRTKYRVGCLTNSNALHWKRFEGFSAHFDHVLSSHLLGAIKPDPECFARALVECGVEAGAVVFFDDSLPNVDAANRAGLRAFHVCGIDEVERAVRQEGLLP